MMAAVSDGPAARLPQSGDGALLEGVSCQSAMPYDPAGELPEPAGLHHESALLGTLVAGKYRLLRVVGRGGMGTVFKAENTTIGKTVALKLLHHSLADDGVVLQRFEREARITVTVGHPHIVDVLDMGQERTGAPFLVMEYVRGRSLKQVLSEQGPFSVQRAAHVLGQVLDALHAAHARGVVHRDLKPENVLLTQRQGDPDFVKVFDFGISTFIESAAEREHMLDLTPTGYTMATPYYASPEQLRGDKGRDPRVDVYAVGVMLYEVLAGHRPFDARSLPELFTRVLSGDPPPMRVFRRDVPSALEAVVRRALTANLDARYPNAQEFLRALIPFGARPMRVPEPEPTDTFTVDLRAIAQRAGAVSLESEAHSFADGVAPTVVRSLVESFGQRHGIPALLQMRGRLPADVQRELTRCIDQGARLSGWALGRVLEHFDDAFGDGSRSEVALAGRHLARMRRAEASLLGTGAATTPELYFVQAVQDWNRDFSDGTARIQNLGRGYGRLEIVNRRTPELAISVAMLGSLDEGLRLAGGTTVGVRLVGSVAAGDDRDTFEATWSG
jgi:serine/threonine-protein kinase